jgi:hypothetical protein
VVIIHIHMVQETREKRLCFDLMEEVIPTRSKRRLGDKEPISLLKIPCNKKCLEVNPRNWVVNLDC